MNIQYGRCDRVHGCEVRVNGQPVGRISREWGIDGEMDWIYIPDDCDDNRLNCEIPLPRLRDVKEQLSYQVDYL